MWQVKNLKNEINASVILAVIMIIQFNRIQFLNLTPVISLSQACVDVLVIPECRQVCIIA